MESPTLKALEDALSRKKSLGTRYGKLDDHCTQRKYSGRLSGSIQNPSSQTGCRLEKVKVTLEHPGLKEVVELRSVDILTLATINMALMTGMLLSSIGKLLGARA